jgi:hypothetical protein
LKITETHKNGSKIEVSGRNATRVVQNWRAYNDSLETEEEESEDEKYRGVSGYFSSAEERDYESSTRSTWNPVINAKIGFTPNA